jgi:hypothetical protein
MSGSDLLLPEQCDIDANRLCQQYLEMIYQAIPRTVELSSSKRMIAETYGEILYPSVNRLLSQVKLTEQDVFCDFGSGLGKLALQVFMLTPVRAVHAIEIIPALHAAAARAEERLRSDLPQFYADDRKLVLTLGSFLNVPIQSATVVLLGSPCYSPDMLDTVAARIDSIQGVRTVLSLRPLFALKRLRFQHVIRIECSWDTALCYLYS